MGCLGVHFAISDDDVQQLRSITDEQGRLDHLQEEIEESISRNFRSLWPRATKHGTRCTGHSQMESYLVVVGLSDHDYTNR